MKILNLYAGIGGNRKLWNDKTHEITAIEYNDKIADVYCDLFQYDQVYVTDAHNYLIENYQQYDLIWSSPPCQTHSRMRQNLAVKNRSTKPVYPDMSLYQEIIFLQHNFKGKWVVENVKPYYNFLIKPNYILQRHAFWCNFKIEEFLLPSSKLRSAQIKDLELLYGYDLSNYKLPNKRQILRNCVSPKLGLHILESALKL